MRRHAAEILGLYREVAAIRSPVKRAHHTGGRLTGPAHSTDHRPARDSFESEGRG
jgi:hypothetical protein